MIPFSNARLEPSRDAAKSPAASADVICAIICFVRIKINLLGDAKESLDTLLAEL